jgi:hypothetical protein
MSEPTVTGQSISVVVPDKKAVLSVFESYLDGGSWARMGFEKAGESFSVWATNEPEEEPVT